MSSYSQKVQWMVWGGLVLVILGITGAYVRSRSQGGAEAAADQPLLVYNTLSDFTLTNQFGRTVTLADVKGHVWVGDIIFTRCPGPCTAMTKRMAALQAALPANSPVKLVSLTTDPEFDTPAVLKAYGERFGAQPERWTFLTGTKAQIHQLAVDGLKLVSLDKEAARRESTEDLFIHSTIFVLVDRQGRLRATFESDQPDAQAKMLQAVEKVLQEKAP